MGRRRTVTGARIAALAALAVAATGGTAFAQGDTLVNVGSPPTPFSQNKQNEPAIAVDQYANSQFETTHGAQGAQIAAAGSNDNIDMEACNAGPDNDCPFTPGVGVSGIYFTFDGGRTWTQPTYQGYSARNCQGVAGTDDDPCAPEDPGPIGTLPNYREANLVSDGDPALAFGPKPNGHGGFTYANGSRLYYANLTAPFPDTQPFKGDEAIAVSYTDDVRRAAAGDNDAWSDPVIASHQAGSQFSDKEQIWADNVTKSPFFGNVYVCYAQFRGVGNGFDNQPLSVLTSTDGGNSWKQHQVTSATNNIHSRNGFGRSGCTVRTDSSGVVYVYDYQFGFDPDSAAPGQIQMIRSFDGGQHWQRPVNIFTAYDTCNYVEPSIGRCVEDGVAGARSDLSPAPSVDIANGAPSGADATDRQVISWVDGRLGLNNEKVMFSTSGKGGTSWQPMRVVQGGPNDRGYYSAPSISPDGKNVWLVYNAFTTPFANSTAEPRSLVGVVMHAPANGGVGAFTEAHRGLPGDARSSSQNNPPSAEFLGDYVYSAATRTYGTSVWNDVRNGADCPAIDEYRQEVHDEAVETGQQTSEAEEPRGADGREGGRDQGEDEGEAEPPAVQEECPPNFGNSDIYGARTDNP